MHIFYSERTIGHVKTKTQSSGVGMQIMAVQDAPGRNNAEIAAELDLTHETVRNYVSNIFDKLQVNDRAQAIVRARRRAGRDVVGRPWAALATSA